MKPNNYLFPRRYICDRCNTQYQLDSQLYCIIHDSEHRTWNEKVCVKCMIESVKSEKIKKHYKQQLKDQFQQLKDQFYFTS